MILELYSSLFIKYLYNFQAKKKARKTNQERRLSNSLRAFD